MKGGALAVWDGIELPVPVEGKVEGVNEGESTLKVPLEATFLTLNMYVSIYTCYESFLLEVDLYRLNKP